MLGRREGVKHDAKMSLFFMSYIITKTTPPTHNFKLSIKQPTQDPYQQMIHFWNCQEKTFLSQQK